MRQPTPPMTGPPPNVVADQSPQFNSPASPWGPQPVPSDYMEEKTVAVVPTQKQFNVAPERTGAGSLVNNPVQPHPFQEHSNSPIQQLAQRMAESTPPSEDPFDDQYSTDNGKEFKSYEPVSLAELNAIKTPTAKTQKPPITDSGLSNTLPHAPAPIPLPGPKRSRFSDSEDDTESGARSHASSLRFNSSRGGNDGKKVVLMSLVGVAILIVLAVIGFKFYKYYEAAPQQAASPTAPTTNSQTAASPSSPDENATATKPDTHDTTADTTKPAATKPTKPALQRPQTAAVKKKSTVATKPKRVKKAKAVAKAPATSPDVPATVKHRRAYSTYDSYYGN